MQHHAAARVGRALVLAATTGAAGANAQVQAEFTGGIMTIQGRALDDAGTEQRGDTQGTVQSNRAEVSGETGSGLVDASVAMTATITAPSLGDVTSIDIVASGSASQPAGYGGFANITAFTRDFPTDGLPGDWIDLRLTIDQDAIFSIIERTLPTGTSFVNFNPDASTGASIDGDTLTAGTYTMRALLRIRLETTDTFVENSLDWSLQLRPVPTPGSVVMMAAAGCIALRRRRWIG